MGDFLTRRRIATVAGVVLAWAGLWLVWERWTSLSDHETTAAFDLPEATPFRIALVVVTVVAAGSLVKRWLAIPLTIAALVLAGLAGRAALDLFRTSSTFVDVRPGLGVWVCLAGAIVLVVASWPRPAVLAAGLVPLLALLVFSGSQRPASGEVAEVVSKNLGTTMALDGDTILTAVPTLGFNMSAWDPDGERSREVYDTDDVKSSFAEDIQGIAIAGDVLYLSLSGQGVLRVTPDGKARLIAFRPVPNDLDGEPEGNPQRIAGFHPGRIVAAPDGTVYVLSKNQVYRYDGKQFAPIETPELDHPQDIAVDRQNRLYIADTGNGRVLRGKESLIGASAPAHCAQQGLDEPASLDPTHCHAIEALTVDSKGNLFVATGGGIPRVLTLTAEGKFGVVAGTGIAGMAMGDGRAASAQIGAVNKLAIGPHDDLYVGEYERALRIADPVSALNARPAAAAQAPRDICTQIGKFGAATLRAHLVTASEPASLDDLRAAVDRLDGEDELKAELKKRYVDTDSLDTNTTAGNLLRSFAAEHCGLFDGLYPLARDQAMRCCMTYAREWEQVDELRRRDPRTNVPAEKSAPLLGAEIFPPNAPRVPYWQEQLDKFARRACAIPYRWSQRVIN
jgi:hypothetical protein